MIISKCTNLSESKQFGLNIIANTAYEKDQFEDSLFLLRKLLGPREIHSFVFLGDPQIKELGEEVFADSAICPVYSLVRSLGVSNHALEIYSTFNCSPVVVAKLVQYLNPVCSAWRVTPLYYFENDFNTFLKNILIFKDADVLGEITSLIREGDQVADYKNYSLLKAVFKDSYVTLAPKRGEEQSFRNKDSYKSHEIIYSTGESEKVSFYELQGKRPSFEGLSCDLGNHLEIDLSGNIYSCSTAYEKKEVLLPFGFSEDALKSVLNSKFTCPYSLCVHNDNMSLANT